MKVRLLLFFLLLCLTRFTSYAQAVNPVVVYTVEQVETEATSISDGEAPLEAHFKANPTDFDAYSPSYEWHFRKKGEANDFLVRYEENTTYTFNESGTFEITLKLTFPKAEEEVLGADVIEELNSNTIIVSISESKLEFPNAFSPNGDGINDIYKAKDGYKSIVSFQASIYNRWGQKLFEWTDPAKGWDGKFKGNDVKEGVYFVLVKAKGADGRNYNIRKDVNLLRGLVERTTGSR